MRRRVWLLPLAVVAVSLLGCSPDGSEPSAATAEAEQPSGEEATVVHVI